MRRTWIGTVAAAALATAAATGYAAAQEKQPGQQGATTQQMEKGQAHGQMEKGERAQGAMGHERMGQQRNEKPGMENKAEQGQRPGEKPMNKAQTERPKTNAETGQATESEKTQGAQREQVKGAEGEKTQGAQGEKMKGAEQTGQAKQPAQTEKGAAATQTEKGAAATQRNEQATGTQTRTGGAATAQGQQRETHVNPQQVHVTGRTHITNDKAVQISDSLLATARPENVNVALNVGTALPGGVNLLPLPANVVGIVPEFRGYNYVVVNDEIAIVQPSTRQVVDIITTGGGTAMAAGGMQAMAGTRLNPCRTP
jgi:Protein of unknown function (DUF1236)